MRAATALREQDSCLNFSYHYNQGASPIQGTVMFSWALEWSCAFRRINCDYVELYTHR